MDNAQQQTIQGKPVTEPETPLQIFLGGNVNLIHNKKFNPVFYQKSEILQFRDKITE